MKSELLLGSQCALPEYMSPCHGRSMQYAHIFRWQ
jgi:hypothetical protein